MGTYTRTTGAKIASGTSFSYSSTATGVHDLLDPRKVAGSASPLAGQVVREARDNDEHPNSVPIIVGFDETGSMGGVPVQLQKKLAELFSLLLRKGYVEDPQLAVAAYGDGQLMEPSALQFSQFESDNRADEALDVIHLVRGGGGNDGETAALVWYYAAAHTATDAWDKRGKKGYLFTIGDEKTFGVTRRMVEQYISDDADGLEGDLTAKQVAELAKEHWEVFHVIINNATAHGQRSFEHYVDLLGFDHVIVLENIDAVAETIAVQIGLLEGTIDLDDAMNDLDEIGSGTVKGDVGKALAHYSGAARGVVAVADAPADLDIDAPAVRL